MLAADLLVLVHQVVGYWLQFINCDYNEVFTTSVKVANSKCHSVYTRLLH